ncbi:MAG: hypothetical protein BGO98_04785 [Myxococcales bacterium 68-20]|nr:MAG: hypothetical protein BGO98_04785 [Myxococcales bacterium 68-20]
MARAFGDGAFAFVAAGVGVVAAVALFGGAAPGDAASGAEGEGAHAPMSASMAAKRTGRIMGVTLAQIRGSL